MTVAIDQMQRRLWREMVSEKGALRAPSTVIESAYFATPRHRYVSTYRTWDNPRWRAGDLGEVYSDNSLILVGDENAGAISSASQPSFILSLVDSLDIRPGHRILEIGSGCGWLVAIMAHLAGPDGRVYGVEILPELVRQSRQNLAEIRTATIHCADGRDGFPPSAPYDRIISTAAMPTIPPALLDQTAPGARLLLPIATGEATRCNVVLYERVSGGLAVIKAQDGYFVPLA